MHQTIHSMLKKHLWLSLLVLFSAISQQIRTQETNQNFTGIRLFANYSTLHHDTLTLRPVLLPGIGLDYTWFIPESQMAINAGLGYNLRGGSTANAALKFRNHYLDIFAAPRYYLAGDVFFEAGVQAAILLSQRIRELSDETASGAASRPGRDYNSHVEGIAGVGLQLQKGISLNLRYAIPFQARSHSNLQLALTINGSLLRPGKQLQSCSSLELDWMEAASCEKLILHRKGLSSLTTDISSFFNLKELFLDGNKIRQLPDELTQLSYLRRLSIKNNTLTHLPENIGELKQLEELYLDHNQLTDLPAEIGQLESLRFLHISHNLLQNLPPEIGELSNLVELVVNNNGGLLVLPVEINQLKNLERLVVDRNTQFPIPFTPPNARLEIILVGE